MKAFPCAFPSVWRCSAATVLAVLSLAVASGRAQERQSHGVAFERWVRDTFFEGYTPEGYTQKWDIPAEVNRQHGRIPVNPKAAKFRGPVDLGDALRQFDIHEPFWLVIGYWRFEGGARRMVRISAIRVEPEAWRALWEPLTRADLEKLDAVIKDRSLTPEQARAAAQSLKNQPPYTGARMTLNPKIDSRTQRRLQCSLRFDVLFDQLAAPDADRSEQSRPVLWGVPWPGF